MTTQTTSQQNAARIAQVERTAAIAAALQPHEVRAFDAYRRASEAAQEAAAAAVAVINYRAELAAATRELARAAKQARDAAASAAEAYTTGEARAEAAYKAHSGSARQSAEAASVALDLISKISDKAKGMAQFAQELEDAHVTPEETRQP